MSNMVWNRVPFPATIQINAIGMFLKMYVWYEKESGPIEHATETVIFFTIQGVGAGGRRKNPPSEWLSTPTIQMDRTIFDHHPFISIIASHENNLLVRLFPIFLSLYYEHLRMSHIHEKTSQQTNYNCCLIISFSSSLSLFLFFYVNIKFKFKLYKLTIIHY